MPVDRQHSRVIRHGVLHHGKGLHTGKRKGYGIIPGRQCIAVYRPALAVRKGTGEVGCSVPKVPWAASGEIEVKVKINTNDKKAASVLFSLFNFIIKISVTQAVPKHRPGTLS